MTYSIPFLFPESLTPPTVDFGKGPALGFGGAWGDQRLGPGSDSDCGDVLSPPSAPLSPPYSGEEDLLGVGVGVLIWRCLPLESFAQAGNRMVSAAKETKE